jgi:hypothetical protein
MDPLLGSLSIHSLTEGYLYLLVTPCAACGGPLQPEDPGQFSSGKVESLAVPVVCRRCGVRTEVRFDVADLPDEPSRVIDVAGWLTLYTLITEKARGVAEQVQTAPQRTTLRQLQMQAAQCLDEALKFYEPDNDLPPQDALWRDDSRRQYAEHPELFLRGRLVSLRARLPVSRNADATDAG